MIPLDLPPMPALLTPPAIVLPGREETLDRALAQAGVSQRVRREIEREFSQAQCMDRESVLARMASNDTRASVPILLGLLAARRRSEAGGGASIGYALTASPAEDAGNLSDYSFAGVSLGAPFAGRVIVICIAGGIAFSGRKVTSCSVAGNPATVYAATEGAPGASSASAIAIVAEDESETATIEVGWNDGSARCAIDVFAAAGANPTPIAGGSILQHAASTPVGGNIAAVAGGVVFAAATSGGTAVGNTTWGGLDREADRDIENANNHFSSAARILEADTGAHVVEAASESGSGQLSLSAVSLAPA